MRKTWQPPRFEVLELGAEIGSYYEERDFPLLVACAPSGVAARAADERDAAHEGS